MNMNTIGILLLLAAVALAWLSPAPEIAVSLVVAAFVLGSSVARVRSTALRMLAVVPVISLLAIHLDDQLAPWQLVSLGLLMAVLAGPGARTSQPRA
jgi:hypothetical protein